MHAPQFPRPSPALLPIVDDDDDLSKVRVVGLAMQPPTETEHGHSQRSYTAPIGLGLQIVLSLVKRRQAQRGAGLLPRYTIRKLRHLPLQ